MEDDDPQDGSGYSTLVLALTEALGGETRANSLYFEWLNQAREGGASPDHRELFRAEGDVQAKTAFRLGQFFGEYFPWCCGLVFLYAANKLREYVAVIRGMEQQGVDLAEIDDIVHNVDCIVEDIYVDALKTISSERSPSIGSLLTDVSHEFDESWPLYLGAIPQHYFQAGMSEEFIYRVLKQRHAARRALRVRAETKALADLAFSDWMPRNRGHLGDADEALQLAFAIASFGKLRSSVRSRGVQAQLREWLYEMATAGLS